MGSIDDAIAQAISRQRREPDLSAAGCATGCATGCAAAQEAGKPAAELAAKRKPADSAGLVDPFSPEAILRAANEDDDLYDPYSDYMDALTRSAYEPPEADPWR